ncbi:MAG: hypothetical protein K2H43_02070 [Clostridia bacterium]|nr:hypothetical protein [Clostridia bacterium]
MKNKSYVKRLGRSGAAAAIAIACLAGVSAPPVRGVAVETRTAAASREDFIIPSYLQKSAFVGEKVTVATVLPSEDKAENFRSYVLLDGEIVPAERNAFRPERSGVYTCVYEYSYAGQDYRYSYAVTVSVKDAPVFLGEPNFPAAFIAGKKYTLPVLPAADYSQGGSRVEASVSVTADGFAVPIQNGAITPEFAYPGCEVKIVYQAVINER